MSTEQGTNGRSQQSAADTAGAALVQSIFACLSDSGTLGLLVLGAQGKVLLYNARLRELWNLSGEVHTDEEVWPHVMAALSDPESYMRVFESLRHEPSATRQWRVTTRHGRSIECMSMPLPRSPLHETARLFTFRQLDELTGPGERLRRLHHLATAGEMAVGVGHELRNFLIPVTAHARFASDELTGQHPAYEHVAGIVRAAQRCHALLEKILGAARVRGDDRGPIFIGAIAQDLLPLLRAAVAKTIEIRLDVAADTLPALVEPTAIEQLVLNLVLNAAKAMQGGRGVIAITVASRPWMNGAPALVRLTVRDTGVGMDEATVEHIFDPWFSAWRDREGAGVGLAIVRDIVARHGGTIAVDSELGAGTSVHVDFPASHAEGRARPQRSA